LLRFIEYEEDVFWCLLMIMSNMNWRECFLADQPMMMKLQDAMPEMLMRHVNELYLYMLELDPALTQSLNLILP
jgi:hypothetical protein